MLALLALCLLQASLPSESEPEAKAWVVDVAIARRANVVAVGATDGAL